MFEVHPLIESTRTFREQAKDFVSDEAKLIEGIFCSLFAAIQKDELRAELGKEVMRLQFPAVGDEDLLRMWHLALATERSRSPAVVISNVASAFREAKENATHIAKKEKEENNRRKIIKESLDRKFESFNLSPKLLAKLHESGMQFLGEAVRRDLEELEGILGRESWMNKLFEVLKACKCPYVLSFGMGEEIKWWDPPAE